MRWSNKIQDKRAANELIERERPFKTLDELASNLNVTKQRVSQTARWLDRPPFKVIGDDALLELARMQPRDDDEVLHVPGVTPRLASRSTQPILAALERARSAPPPRPPSAEPIDPAILGRYDQLRRWRKAAAAERGVESDIVLPREVLWDIARAAPRALADLRPILDCLPWRLQAYGPALLQALWGTKSAKG